MVKLGIIPSNQLPDCDVLEMDCEGADTSILSNLNIRPRVIIVEIHPHKHGLEPVTVPKRLREMRYEIQAGVDQHGRTLIKDELDKVLHHDRKEGKQTEWGLHPPIVVATKPK